jgi:hypothetical protein
MDYTKLLPDTIAGFFILLVFMLLFAVEFRTVLALVGITVDSKIYWSLVSSIIILLVIGFVYRTVPESGE